VAKTSASKADSGIRRSFAGVRLIEELARKPHVHVAAWKLEDDDVRSTVRGALLQVRHLSIANIVLMTSHNVTDLLLDTVSTVHVGFRLIGEVQRSMKFFYSASALLAMQTAVITTGCLSVRLSVCLSVRSF